MPAPLDVDWEAVRTLAVAVGVREAARQMGIDENAACQRSAREGWLKSLPRDTPLPPTIRPTPVSGVITAPQAMGNALRDMSTRTRLGHARVAQSVAEHVETMDGQEALMAMPTILQAVKHASVCHGWQAGAAPVAIVNIHGGRELEKVVMESPEEVEEPEEGASGVFSVSG